jgi:nicotinate-nucleotide adenylyltransferase
VAGEAAWRQLDVDVVTFVPAGAPWQKAGAAVSNHQTRWEMVVRSVDGVEYFEADAREVHRDGWTFTIETLESFDADDELWLVLGADAAANLPTWNRAHDVLRRAKVAVAPRPGTDRMLVEAAIGQVMWLDMPSLLISGTEIRQRARNGRSVRFLVRDSVWRYVEEHNVYRPV